MVTRVLNLFYREIRGLHQAAYVLALFALASQVLAIVRDRLLASQFGAGTELDIYYAAFRIPDLLFVLFASVLSVYVLLPFVTRAQTESNQAAQAVLSQMFTLFLLGYVLIAGITFVVAPLLSSYLFPGFSPEAQAEAVMLLRILLLQPLLLGISSLLSVVTQIGHRFVIYAFAPLLYNIGIIIGAAFLYPVFGIAGLAYGVVIGALFHCAIQLPLVYTSNLRFCITTTINRKTIWSIAQVAIPRAITLSLSQVMLLVLVMMATTMSVGSVAVLQFAYNLQSVPLAIIGMSYSVAAFPTLASLLADKKQSEFNTYVLTALRHVIFWSTPVVVLVIVLRAQLVRVLLGSGSFDWADTRLTAAALAIFVVSLLAQSILLLIVRAFYAGGFTRLPLIVTFIGTLFSGGFAYGLYVWFISSPNAQIFFTKLFRLENVAGSEVLMLPLGYALGVIIEVVLMLIFASRTFGMELRSLAKPFTVAVVASVTGGLFAYATLLFVVEGVNQNTFVGILIQGAVAGVFGLLGVVIAYRLLGSPEMHEIYVALKGRLRRREIIPPQPDLL
ncbi:oligosaccharide flippase family protein [Patescibacteria group bacterium]|nr:oligosaccharide flippase family protein [Patescibacteria group bacterium]